MRKKIMSLGLIFGSFSLIASPNMVVSKNILVEIEKGNHIEISIQEEKGYIVDESLINEYEESQQAFVMDREHILDLLQRLRKPEREIEMENIENYL